MSIKTGLPVGTWIRCRNSRMESGFEYGRIVNHGSVIGWEIGSKPPTGVLVHKVVWKADDRIESRGTYTYPDKNGT